MVAGRAEIQLDVYTEPTPYILKVHQRRTRLSIEVKNQQITVKSPPHCTNGFVRDFLISQQSWIKRALKSSEQKQSFTRLYQSGEPIWLLGTAYELDIHTDCPSSAVIKNEDGQTIEVYLSSRVKNHNAQIRKLLHEFYLNEAKSFLPSLVQQCESETELHSSSLDFKFYQWRWGCCYQSGKVILNPLLMGAPLSVIRCVIIHELCHLKHMDHGRQFWQLNKQFCDVCSETKAWLKQHHHLIYLPPQ